MDIERLQIRCDDLLHYDWPLLGREYKIVSIFLAQSYGEIM